MFFFYHSDNDELEKKSQLALQTEKYNAMPIIRRQLNRFLQKETGSTFTQHMEVMHKHAVDGYKRSNIPNPGDGKGEALLAKIKEVRVCIPHRRRWLSIIRS